MLTSTELKKLAKEIEPAVVEAVKKAHVDAMDEVLNVATVASMLGMSKEAIRKRCRENRIPYNEVDGRYYFSKNSINTYYLGI